MSLIQPPRRHILQSGLAAVSVVLTTQTSAQDAPDGKVADVTPPEDLMREHGVLDRVLLIYEAVMRKFGANGDFNPKVISDSAKVVQNFVENYHEKSEENFIFPRFRKSGELIDLVETLLQQHQARLPCDPDHPSTRASKPARRRRPPSDHHRNAGLHCDVPPACGA